jgi:putative transposase
MTRPRMIYEGASYRLSMRCVFRQSLLTACSEVNNAVGYWLGVTSQRYGIQVHSFVVMSNHIHLDVTDPGGRVCAFVRDFKAVLARVLNAHWGRWEYFWGPSPGGMQRVVTARDAALSMAYTIANPVSAGLVSSPEAWPGENTTVQQVTAAFDGTVRFTYARPSHFFRDEESGGKAPASVTWSLAPHPLGLDDPESFKKDVQAETQRRIDKKRAEVRRGSGRFAGQAEVLRRKWWQAPKTPTARRQRNPRFAGKSKAVRLTMIQLERLSIESYRAARSEWFAEKPAYFPVGTYQMKPYPGVSIRGGPIGIAAAIAS